jgi:hypothetical protein
MLKKIVKKLKRESKNGRILKKRYIFVENI